MPTKYLNYLKSTCKKFIKKFKKKNIIDIILFGSSVKGAIEIRDIDILLIFLNETLKERAIISQELKTELKNEIKVDIKTINLEELFEKEFLARQGILVEGYSLLDDAPFSKKMGFVGYSLFAYSLRNLNHNEKTKFTYALIGRKQIGILKKLNAESVGRGSVLIPIKNSLIFEEFLKKWNINYKKKNILVS